MDRGSDNLDPRATSHSSVVVLVKVFSDRVAAESAAALLEANGISSWLNTDDCGGMLPTLDNAHGVKLSVALTNVDAAKELLATTSTGVPSLTRAALPSKAKISLLQIAAGIIVGVLLCLLYQYTTRLGTKSYPIDSNRDGRTDENWIYHNGYLVEQTLDRNFDGQLDAWSRFDNTGRRIDYKTDENFDGAIDATALYTQGVLASASMDTDFNGIPDVTYYYKDDVCIRGDWQPNGTNIVTLREVFSHGRLTEELRDTNFDGSFDVSIRFDAFLNPISTNTPLQLRTLPQ